MYFDGLVEIFVALIAGGGIKHLVDYLIKSQKLKNASKIDAFKKTFEDIHKVYRCLNYISLYCSAKRVVIVKVENGGGVPTVNSHLRSTILYEVFENPLTSTKTHWQNVKVGKEYIEYVKKIYEDGKNSFKVSEIHGSELKDLHEEHNTKFVISYFLVKSHKYFIYLSIQFDKDNIDIEPSCRNSIRENKSKLCDILKEENNQLFIDD